jgi:hypothetical protein
MKSIEQYCLRSCNFGFTDGSDYKVHCWDGLRWHDKHSKFHGGCLGVSNNIKVITSTNWKAAVLVLLMEDIHIYEVHCWDGLRCHEVQSFMMIRLDIQVLLRLLFQQFERIQCWYHWWHRFMMYTIEMAPGGMIYLPSFMTIGSGIQVILRILPQQFESQQYWYYWWDRFMRCAVEIASDGMIYIWCFMRIGIGIQVILRVLP